MSLLNTFNIKYNFLHKLRAFDEIDIKSIKYVNLYFIIYYI